MTKRVNIANQKYIAFDKRKWKKLTTWICITDNGCGIEQEDLGHIFERFYKGKNALDKSFGIGLSLSRMIINKQNGTIKVENRSMKGAKFTIRFYKEIIKIE